jgi:uncharacterized Zn-binding protein involved in type VI secretion
MTATGDAITGPGAPTVLIGGLPAACVGDMVSGSVCVGAIMMGSFTVLIMNRPAATVGSQVVGVNPITGIPVSTVVGPPGAPTVILG